jgi:hypothetical protein
MLRALLALVLLTCAAGAVSTAVSQDHGAHETQHTDSVVTTVAGSVRAVATRQFAYRANNSVFAMSVDSLDIAISSAIEVLMRSATASGFAVVARSKLTGAECTFFHGTAERPRSHAVTPDQVHCTDGNL